MRNRLAFISVASVLVAAPAFAVTSSAVLLKCQKVLESRVRSFSNYAATHLVNCTRKVADCKLADEIDSTDPTACLASATSQCGGTVTNIGNSQTTNRTKALLACGLIPTADVTPFIGGLGFFNVLADCGGSDVTDLVTCIFDQARCRTERALFRADPRAQDSLTTVGVAASFPCVAP
jgi:hypothetical protein